MDSLQTWGMYMYLAEQMNLLDFGFTSLKVTGVITYANTASDHTIIRTSGIIFSGCPPSVRPVLVIALSQEPIDGFPPKLGHVCILFSLIVVCDECQGDL